MAQTAWREDADNPRMLLAVGPERGWKQPEEMDLLLENGFELVGLAGGLGPMRTDVAFVALVRRSVCWCFNRRRPTES